MAGSNSVDRDLRRRAEAVIPGGMYGHQSVALLPDDLAYTSTGKLTRFALDTCFPAQRKVLKTSLLGMRMSAYNVGYFMPTPEQQAAVQQFLDEKLRIRKELREVRFQLNSKIEELGGVLKFVNIALVPLLLTLGVLALWLWRRRRHG